MRLHPHCLPLFAVTAAGLLLSLSGCAACCAPFDCDYGYQGGAWIRDNPSWGRVGSIFEPAGYKALPDDAPTEGQPTPAEPPSDEDAAPMPMEDMRPEMTPETSVPRQAPNMISAPRLRPVRNYLSEN